MSTAAEILAARRKKEVKAKFKVKTYRFGNYEKPRILMTKEQCAAWKASRPSLAKAARSIGQPTPMGRPVQRGAENMF